MSTLKTTNLQSSDASSANIVLGQGSGGGATISGVTTSSTLRATTGIVTTATITTADVTTSRTTTGITTTATIDTATVGGVTTLNSDGVNCTGITTATHFNPTVQPYGTKNLVINGAFNIAQRATTSTTAGYQTVDRWTSSMANVDEACTFAQADVAADTDPWNVGFRKSFKVTNGNQTSGAGAADDVSISQNIESQDLAKSGWDYTSSSSYITLSFWAKSSVAQTFYTGFRIYGSDQREYCFAYTLAANTWKKVTHSIPGGDGHTIVDTTAIGAFIQWPLWWGTNYTSSGRAVNTWQIKNNASNYPDNTSTWYTTNDATFEVTGVQLEVGSAATPFEHRSYADELLRCQRYCQVFGGANDYESFATGVWKTTTAASCHLRLITTMRTAPTMTVDNPTASKTRSGGTNIVNTTVALDIASPRSIMYNSNVTSGATAGHGALHYDSGGGSPYCKLTFSAEI